MTNSVRITSADFNGSTWDGPPFDPTPPPYWLLLAVSTKRIDVQAGSEDYAWWKIKTPSGSKFAGPGDSIEYNPGDGSLEVRYGSDDAQRRFAHMLKNGVLA